VGDWSRVIGALARLRLNSAAQRAERVAADAPRVASQFEDQALQQAFMPGRRGGQSFIAVGPPSSFDTYAPLLRNNPSTHVIERGPSLEDLSHADDLRRLLYQPGFTGYDQVPLLDYRVINNLTRAPGELSPYRLDIVGHDGRHRSMALAGDNRDSTVLRLRAAPDEELNLTRDQLLDMPARADIVYDNVPPLRQLGYRLYSRGGPV
jgi:hypothetical protein